MELRHILEILWRRKWIIINVFSAILLTIVIISLLVMPWYDSTAKILLRKSSASSSVLASIGLSSGGSSSTSLSDTDRADYLALAAVRPVAERVISELNVKRERTRSRIMKAIPGLKTLLGKLGVDVTATEEIITAEDLLDSSVMSYLFPRPYLSVDQYESTDILEIEALSPDPQQAMQLANAMAKHFIDEELKRVREDYAGAKVFIDKNIVKARSEYIEALNAVKGYKEKEKFVNLDSEASDIIQRISDLKRSSVDNNMAIEKTTAAIEKIESQLKSTPKYQKTSEQLKDNDMISSLKLTLRDLYLNLAETKSKYTKDHPVVIDIENKIAETKDLLKKEVEKVFGSETISLDPLYQDLSEKLAGYYADLAGYESQNQAFPRVISRYEAEMMKLPKKVSDYSHLQLAATVTQDIYDSLLKYQYQIVMAESIALSNIYVVEPAIAAGIKEAKHRHPSLLLNTIIAILLGVTFGIGAALLIEYLDDTIRSTEDIKAHKSLTFLGSLVMLKKKDPKLIDALDPRAPLRETFRTIRNSIRFATLDKPPKAIVITSSMEGEGKSFVAANLAISVANEGKRVLIMDCDLRRPGIPDYFKVPNNFGLTNFLVGDADVKAIQLPTGVANLTVIPTGPIPPDPAKLVESQKMHQLVKEMMDAYDFVVVDTPPILAASDAIVFGNWVDGMVVIVESGRASKKHFPEIVELVRKANINVIGAILNKVVGRETGYYYYHYKYYHK